MFGKKKKKNSKARRARPLRPARQPKRVDPAALARRKKIRQITLVALASATIALGLIFGLDWLSQDVLEKNIPPVSSVILADKPLWLDSWVADEIEQLAVQVVRENPTDPKLAEKVAHRLTQNIWVRKIAPAGVVNNYDDGTLTIRCEFRRPLAIVSIAGVSVRIDNQALVLPGRSLRSGVPVGQYAEIIGVDSDPPEEGQFWNAEDLLAAVNILRLIDGKPFTKEITAIDVSNYRGRYNTKPHIVLTTEKQSRLYWGRAIGTEGQIEVDYKTKLDHLEKLFIQYGSLNNLLYADLRGQKVLFKKRERQ